MSADMYIEFIAVRRHLLQLECEYSETAVLAAAKEVAIDGSCAGLQMLDSDAPLIVAPPFGGFEFGENEEGPSFFAGDVFGKGTEWMRKLASDLVERADAIDAAAVSA